MSDPWVPPYFGSWDRLVAYVINAALHPHHSPLPNTHFVEDALRTSGSGSSAVYLPQDPVPVLPWGPVVSALVAAVNAQQLAATVEGPLRGQIEKSASASIAQLLDDYCGTPPRKVPWPFPGPPPWVFVIASELNALANSGVTTGMREGLQRVAGLVLQHGSRQAAA
jgi:hypothetical protein